VAKGQRIDQLYWDLGTNLAPLNAGIGQATGMLKKLGAAIVTPTGMFVALGAAAVLAGVKGTKMAAELDKAMRELSTLLPTTVDQMGELRDQIIKLSTEVPKAPVELVQGMYEVVSAGITDTAAAYEVLEVAAKAGVAGLTETTTVVNALTTVLNSYGMGAGQATRVSDVLFQTVNEGVIRFGELATQIGDVANTAALTGQSIEVVGAAIATMTQRGIMGAEAVTSLNRLLLALMDTESLGAAKAEEMGMEFGLAALKSKGLAGMMAELKQVTGGNVQVMAQILPELRAFRAASVLAGTGTDQFVESIGRMEKASGTTETAVKKMNGELGNQWKLLKNKVNVSLLELGNNTLPIVARMLGLINAALDKGTESWDKYGTAQAAGLAAAALSSGGELPNASSIAHYQDMLSQVEGARALFNQLSDEVDDLLAKGTELTSTKMQKAVAAMRTVEVIYNRLKALAVPTGAAAPPPSGLDEKISDFNKAMGELSEKIKVQGPDVAGLTAEYEALRQKLAETVEEAERLVMAQSDVLSFQENVEGLLQAWAAMPREMGTSVVMLQTIRKQMTLTGRSVDDMTDSERQMYGMLEAFLSGPGAELPETLDDTLHSVSMLARGLLDLGRSFGFMGDNAAASLNSVANIADQLFSMKAAGGWGALGGLGQANVALGIGAGLASILSGIFADKGPSPEEVARTEALKANNEALERLNTHIDKLADVLVGAKGAGIFSAASKAIEAFGGTEFTGGVGWMQGRPKEVLEDTLKSLGFTLEDFTELAESMGLTMDFSTESLAAFKEALDKINSSLMFETFAGQMSMIQAELDMFDVTDPIKKLEMFRDALVKYANLPLSDLIKLRGFNLETEEGRAAMSKWVEETWAAIKAGTFDLSKLGPGVSLTDFMGWLSDFETMLDEKGGEEGTTQAFQISRSITEVTGNRIAGILTTVSYWGERTALGVEALVASFRPAGVQAPTPSEMASFMRGGLADRATETGAGGPQVITITVGDIIVQGAVDAGATARAVAASFVDEVDRALGDKLLGVRRARGLAMPDGLRS